jgi:hypothetical protein
MFRDSKKNFTLEGKKIYTPCEEALEAMLQFASIRRKRLAEILFFKERET